MTSYVHEITLSEDELEYLKDILKASLLLNNDKYAESIHVKLNQATDRFKFD